MEICCAKLPSDVVKHIFDLAYDGLSIDARLALNVAPKKLDQTRLAAASEMIECSEGALKRLDYVYYDTEGLFCHRIRTIQGTGTFSWQRPRSGAWKLVKQPEEGLALATYEMWYAFAWSDPKLFHRLQQRYQTIRVYLTHTLINNLRGYTSKNVLTKEFKHEFKSNKALKAWIHLSLEICWDLRTGSKDSVGARFNTIMQRMFDHFII